MPANLDFSWSVGTSGSLVINNSLQVNI